MRRYRAAQIMQPPRLQFQAARLQERINLLLALKSDARQFWSHASHLLNKTRRFSERSDR
jgi:hypothetical protein